MRFAAVAVDNDMFDHWVIKTHIDLSLVDIRVNCVKLIYNKKYLTYHSLKHRRKILDITKHNSLTLCTLSQLDIRH